MSAPTTSTVDSLRMAWERHFQPTYGTPPVALAHGSGAHVWDTDGREYIDLYAGIAVSALGHAHPAVVEAVSAQVARLGHVSNYFLTEPTVRLGVRLAELAGGDGARVFLCNSGAEANEAAIKLIRRARPGRNRIIAAAGGFHGRTIGALSITGQPTKRAPFEPLLSGVEFVPYDDAAALRRAVTPDTAAVFLEPVQGESGVIPATEGYLTAAREACDAAGALLAFDEVQGGIGRTGRWFSHQAVAPGVVPDVITLAKGLGGGLPIGACISTPRSDAVFAAGDHGSTFGGNPVAAAAALAVLDTIAAADLLTATTHQGERLRAALDHPGIASIRGIGLWLGALLTAPDARQVEATARAHGVLVNAIGDDVIRLAPALSITTADIDEGAARLRAALDKVVP